MFVPCLGILNFEPQEGEPLVKDVTYQYWLCFLIIFFCFLPFLLLLCACDAYIYFIFYLRKLDILEGVLVLDLSHSHQGDVLKTQGYIWNILEGSFDIFDVLSCYFIWIEGAFPLRFRWDFGKNMWFFSFPFIYSPFGSVARAVFLQKYILSQSNPHI